MRVALLSFLALLTACTTWQAVTTPTPMDPTFQLRGNVRITEVNGRAHFGKDVVGRGDYLVLSRYDGSPDSVARIQVRSIESGVGEDQKSFLIVGVVAGAVVLLAVAFAGSFAPGPY